MMVFTGNTNPDLARRVIHQLYIPLGGASAGKFSGDGINIEINRDIRGRDVFLIRLTCASTDGNLVELVVITDAFRRSSATRITAVIPYLDCARRDRHPRSARMVINAKIVVDMPTAVGVNRVLTTDLHTGQIQGPLDIPVNSIYGSPVLVDDTEDQYFEDLVIIPPDADGVVRARTVAKFLGMDLAIIDKRRSKANQSEVMYIIDDVEDRTYVLVNDMVDTVGTPGYATEALKECDAVKIITYRIHPMLSGRVIENIEKSVLDELMVANTIPLSAAAQVRGRIRQLDIAPAVTEVIRRISNEESINAMLH